MTALVTGLANLANSTANAVVLAAEKPNQIFFPGDINEFYWGSLAFLVVIGFLAWKVLPSARKMMKAGADKIAEDLQVAETSKQENEQRTASLKQQLGDIGQKQAELLAEAKQSADSLEAELVAKAEAEAQEIQSRGEAEVELMRRQATADLQAEVGGWVAGAAQTLIEEVLQTDQATQAELVEDYINNDLRQLSQPAAG